MYRLNSLGLTERLRDRIRQLYQLAKASVDEELNGTSQQPAGNNGHGGDHNSSAEQEIVVRAATPSRNSELEIWSS